jgi:hypothetical protein
MPCALPIRRAYPSLTDIRTLEHVGFVMNEGQVYKQDL